MDLQIKAHSRQGIPLCTYEITPGISGPLGASLAKVILAGLQDNVPADSLLLSLHHRVKAFGCDWKLEPVGIAPQSSKSPTKPLASVTELVIASLLAAGGDQDAISKLASHSSQETPPSKDAPAAEVHMERVLPSFPEFATNPRFAMDRVWVSERRINNQLVSVTATLIPDRQKVAFDVEVLDSEGEPTAEESFVITLPTKDIFRRPSTESVHLALEKVAEETLYDFRINGLDSMLEKVSHRREKFVDSPSVDESAWSDESLDETPNTSIDERLRQGDRSAGDTVFAETLPSGAEVSINIGEKTALLIIKANSVPGAASVGWAINDERGVDRPSSAVFKGFKLAAQMLCTGSGPERLNALTYLDKVSQDTTGRSPFAGGCVLDEVLSFDLQTDLEQLPKIEFDSIPAVNHEQILELLQGIQLVQVKLSNPSFKSSSPTSFDRLMFGVYPDGSLYVQTKNPLSGQLKARLSARTCNEAGGYREVIRSIASQLDKSQTLQKTRIAVHKALESFVNKDADANTIVSPYDQSGSKVPPLDRPLASKAYDAGGKLARIWEHASGRLVSDVRLEWLEGTDIVRASIGEIGLDSSSLQIEISHEGVFKVVAQVGYGEPARKYRRIVTDMRAKDREPLKDSTSLTNMFRLLQELGDSSPETISDVDNSRFAKFMKSL